MKLGHGKNTAMPPTLVSFIHRMGVPLVLFLLCVLGDAACSPEAPPDGEEIDRNLAELPVPAPSIAAPVCPSSNDNAQLPADNAQRRWWRENRQGRDRFLATLASFHRAPFDGKIFSNIFELVAIYYLWDQQGGFSGAEAPTAGIIQEPATKRTSAPRVSRRAQSFGSA